MSQTHTIGKHATKVSKHGDNTIIRYHSTDVVVFNNEWVKLDNGGWFTPSTKDRMNQSANQYDLDFKVYQKNYTWYVVTPKGETHQFNVGGHFSFPRT